jgi:hypothetical protein
LRIAGDDAPAERVIDKACRLTSESIIEIPEVEVAGLRAGPV